MNTKRPDDSVILEAKINLYIVLLRIPREKYTETELDLLMALSIDEQVQDLLNRCS